MNNQELREQLRAKHVKRESSNSDYLSTGSSLLNLACTGDARKGFAKGKYYLIVGDSQSGKTFLSLTCLAEAAQNPYFKDHRFIFDNSEDGALMNIEKFFGGTVAQKIESPAKDSEGGPIYSRTIEEWAYHIDDALKDTRPFIYVLDSMDSLSSEAEIDKFEEQKTAYRKGKTTTGSYGDGKAKKNSQNIRRIIGELSASNSILIIISQTRDSLGFGFETKTRAGGKALRFYNTLEIWSSIGGRIKKTVKGKDRVIGVKSLLKIKKNRITGREREVMVPIYYTYGFDDIGACINYLLDEKHWAKRGGKIIAEEMNLEGKKDNLIQQIEEANREEELRDIVQTVWNEIEDKCDPKRKKRYK